MNILLIVLSVLSISFFGAFVYTLLQLKKTTKAFIETFLLYASAKDYIQSISPEQDSDESIHKENFIKFLSESRDWAYTYIEDVQKGISEFVEEVGPRIEYFNQYGIVIEGSPHYKDMKLISENFEKLKKFLPEDPK